MPSDRCRLRGGYRGVTIQRRAARARQASWLRLVSPALLTMDGLADAAGIGEARHRHFMDQVHGFHGQWRAFFAPRVLSADRVFDHDGLPAFEYQQEPARLLLLRSARLFIATAGVALLFGWLTLRRCRSLPMVLGNV